ncbi:MAG TPA: hypothetical protein PL041_13580, partial [Melioribacteraceae bacterium]|nr:hypothetical protein [Melioribacteraceae bacterium]
QNKIYVADTYNNKIKVIDLDNKIISTLAGNGKEGNNNGSFGSALFNEPAGITILNNKLYVADTNNNLIRILDLNSKTVSTLLLKPKETFTNINLNDITFNNSFNFLFNSNNKINIVINIPSTTKINPYINSMVNLFNGKGELINNYLIEDNILSFSVDLSNIIPPITINPVIYYCDKQNEGLCYIINNFYKLENAGSNDFLEIIVE